jgi:hypothetical protein
MKTTNVILLGVVGVGAVGAYMYMKNKQAQNALLSGSLPAPATSQGGFVATPATNQGGFATAPTTNQGGFATAPTTNQGGGFATAPTTPALSTVSDGVSPSDANINLANATVLVGQRAILQAKIKAPLPSTGFSIGGWGTSQTEAEKARTRAMVAREVAKKELVELDKKLASLGYKVDANGSLVRI